MKDLHKEENPRLCETLTCIQVSPPRRSPGHSDHESLAVFTGIQVFGAGEHGVSQPVAAPVPCDVGLFLRGGSRGLQGRL